MSRESSQVHAGIQLNVVVLHLRLSEFLFISSLFLILLTGPVLPFKSPESRWMDMEADSLRAPWSPKLLLSCLRVQMAGCKISQEARRPSSRVQAPINKSRSFSQYSVPGYQVAFVIHLSPEHLVMELPKFLMTLPDEQPVHNTWGFLGTCTSVQRILNLLLVESP